MQTEADYLPRRYQVRHVTRYTYDDDVQACYERGMLSPRQCPSQQVVTNRIEISPEPDLVTDHVDFFGNHSHYVEVFTPHTELVVTKTSIVDVAWPPVDEVALAAVTVEQAAAMVAVEDDPVFHAAYTLPSVLVDLSPEVVDYAHRVLAPSRPLGEALQALYHDIHQDFRYAKGVTSVKTTLPELLDLKAGVCQDFAHLAIGALRCVGLPARYVSGYLETTPPPGKPKLAGSDASHAWASVLVPGGRWIDLDPTNDHFADSRYVVTAWGRDFRDVSPLKGVVYTESATSSLDVAVDVVRLPAEA